MYYITLYSEVGSVYRLEIYLQSPELVPYAWPWSLSDNPQSGTRVEAPEQLQAKGTLSLVFLFSMDDFVAEQLASIVNRVGHSSRTGCLVLSG